MNTSHWIRSSALPRFPAISRNLKVDAIVIGGGLTGITTAYLLKKAGVKVALLERDRFARVDTGHTTAHLTCVTDTPLTELIRSFGKDHAQAVWDSGLAAIEQIHENIHAEEIECGFRWVPGYLHGTLTGKGRTEAAFFKKEATAAQELGFDAQYLESIPLVGRSGVRFANQALFHPLRYLASLLERIPGRGSHLFEASAPDEITDDPLTVKVGGRTIRADKLIIATHVPLMGVAGLLTATLFQTKLASYSTYAIGAKVPKGRYPSASFWDTSDPYYFLRIDPGPRHDYAVFGGQDHKTGQRRRGDDPYRVLEQVLLRVTPDAKVDARWTGQVIESHDGLPLIGELTENQFISTAYSGNGMTFGTLSAMMACDWVLDRRSPWAELYDVRRKKVRRAAWDYVKENLDYPYYLAKDRLLTAEAKSLRGIRRGDGKILRIDGRRVAAYRDPKGAVTLLSPVCTHMGCFVRWNDTDATWDCPCHGSRFRPTGEVIAGPAEDPLEKVETGGE